MSDFVAFSDTKHEPFEFQSETDKIAILIHGFPGTPYEMRDVGQLLKEQGYTAKGLLLPGFGPDIEKLSSMREKDWTSKIRQEIRDANEKTKDVILVGYSFGAALSIITLIDYPELQINKLILIAPFWNIFAAYPLFIRIFGPLVWPIGRLLKPDFRIFDNIDFDNPEEREDLMKAFDGVDLDDPEVREFIKNITIPFAIIDELFKIGRRAKRSISNIDLPLLIIQGTKDEVVPVRSTDKLVKTIKHKHRYITLENLKHEFIKPDHNNRAKFSPYIVNFLEE